MPEEEKKKTRTQLGKEKRLAEKADRKAASDARRAKTAEKQAAVDNRVNNGTQRQRETARRMNQREFNAGLNLRGNDPMAGRRTPVGQVGTQGDGINFTSTQMSASGGGGGGVSEVSRLQITKKTPPFYSGDPPAANEFFVSAGLYNGSIPTNIENKFTITVAADTNFYFWLEVTLSSNNPAFATAIVSQPAIYSPPLRVDPGQPFTLRLTLHQCPLEL